MRIEQGNAHTSYAYWTVLVSENELQVESGKRLPYSAWVGVLRQDRTPVMASVWSPAGYKPRGYRKAALELLSKAYQEMTDAGWPQSLELQPREVVRAYVQGQGVGVWLFSDTIKTVETRQGGKLVTAGGGERFWLADNPLREVHYGK